ncbi:P2Y purinoceptor 2 [Amia ocellicauda]|uniref:P2Y purinoceptor 2 n=1 Tax=Amia ocellicauda TaxID=2972642 RepID=UPI003464B81E
MMAVSNKTTLNQSSPYKCQLDENFKYILLPTSYGLVFVIGLVLNIMAMYVIVFRTKHWKPSTIYMFNLTVSDTLYILTLPFLVYYYADASDWPFSEPLCKIIRFLFYANLYTSILFLSCISIHRFLGVCYPMQSLQWVSTLRARLISVGVWVTIMSFQSPILYFSRTTTSGQKVCYDTTSIELFNDFLVYSSIISVVLFCIPFMVVVVCYCLMVKKLLEPSAGGASSLKSKQKSIKMIIIVLGAFMICFLPFHLTRTLYYMFRYMDVSCTALQGASIAYKVTKPLASANSCLDPILYFLAGQSFRKNFTTRKRKSCSPNVICEKTSSTQL